MALPSSSEPIASRAASEAIHRLRLENAQRISALRIFAVGAAGLAFLVFGRVLGVDDYRGGDGVLAVQLILAAALYVWVRRSERAAGASAYALALLDVPVLALIELSLLPRASNPEELVAFNAATMLVFVMAATLFLAKAPIIAAAVSASVCHGLLQLHTGAHPSTLASTAITFGLAGALCSYAAYRMRGLVVAGAVRGLELEGAERTLERQRELLRASEERFRSLLDLAPDGAFIVRAGEIVYANQPLTQLLGYQAEGLSGRSVETLVVPEDRTHVLSPETAAASASSEPREVRLAMRGGEVRHVELVGRPIEMDGVASWLFMTRDLTERRVLQARLIGADRLASMGLLAAGVAHEINTPLAVVIASLEYLESELDAAPSRETEELRAPLLDAREAAARASEIVRDLRLFSRAEEARSANVRDALESAVRMASGALRQRARLERQLSEVPRVRASESRLAQVFLNLLNNAVEAFDGGSSETNVVTLRTFADRAGWAVVEVSDTGSGILPADLPRVFRPFFTTKPQGVGSGLGLAICERLVTEIGGRIEIDTSVGRGSTFRVSLPPADASVTEVAARQKETPTYVRPLRVLVIDDDSAICRAISRLLGREDDVTTLESSREALDLLARGARFDVIFCDVMMPNLPGAELLRILSAEWPDQASRVVFLTGGVLSGAGRSFLEQNPGRLIEKPFTLAEVRRAIEGRIAECGLPSVSGDAQKEPGPVEELAPRNPA